MRIRTLLIGGTITSTTAVVAVIAGLCVVVQDMERSFARVNAARLMTQILFEESSLLDDYLLYPGERAREQWRYRHRNYQVVLDQMAESRSDPLLERMRQNQDKMGIAFARLITTMKVNGTQKNAGLNELQEHRVSQVRLAAHEQLSLAATLASHENESLEKSLYEAIWLTGLLVALIALLMAGTWSVLGWRVAHPIARFRTAIQVFKGGAVAAWPELDRKDEIGDLARAFQGMARNLDSVMVSREELAKEIAERRQAEQTARTLAESLELRSTELASVNKELEAFAYSVSHDLRAPLRSMTGFCQAVLEDYTDRLDDVGRDYLRRISVSASRMGRLIDDLLMLSRVTRTELRRMDVSLSDLAQQIAEQLRMSDPERDVEFKIQPHITAEGDETLLRTALENLLGNAWKYSSKSPRATIEFGATVSGKAQAQIYYVQDNGVGFDMAYADKLFQPFQRLHGESEFEGTGIGLASVANIVRRHGGRIWAESKPGQGTTMQFTL